MQGVLSVLLCFSTLSSSGMNKVSPVQFSSVAQLCLTLYDPMISAELFLDSMGGGAWPFLVGGAICLVNSVNERDLSLLTSYAEPSLRS